jgi:hypothetical protein
VLKPGSDYNSILISRYKALQYENDGQVCIITGPLADSNLCEGREGEPLSIPSVSIFLNIGCLVICEGLLNTTHLNCKLGDMRSIAIHTVELLLAACFEDKSWGSAAVKPGNLHIAFDLPAK